MAQIRSSMGGMKSETITDMVVLLILFLVAGAGFLVGWRSAMATEARRRYRAEIPRFQHNGETRDSD